MSKNDVAWEALFDRYRILDEILQSGVSRISSLQINQFREARLMTKFDHKVNLPKIFRDNGLCVLPDSRGTYLIGYFDAYEPVVSAFPVNPTEFILPSTIETIDYSNLYSEVSALLCAYNAGIIQDVVGEQVSLTVFGRMSTSQFDYRIRHAQKNEWYPISVDNAQCEIDGGFEGLTTFAIIEAKNYSIDDFLIRQIYYPHRLWQAKISKSVIPIFLTYSNDVFTFLVYRFNNAEEYNSIELVDQKFYRIASENIELTDIYSVFKSAHFQPEPIHVSFPQADNFRRVIDLLGLLYQSDLSQSDITQRYQFDRRQTQYYADAAIYLGLVEKYRGTNRSVIYKLSNDGRSILDKPTKRKYLALVNAILRHEVFYTITGLYFEKSIRPQREEVLRVMQNSELNIDKSTIPRRAQTVSAWVDWILSLQRSSK